MPAELDTAAIIAGLIFWTVLICSAALWIKNARSKNVHSDHPLTVSAWPIGWVNFGTLICAMIISVFVVQVLSLQFISAVAPEGSFETADETPKINDTNKDTDPKENNSVEEEPELTPWMAVWAVLSLQVPMLATFYGLRKLYPNHYTGKFNQQPLTIGGAMVLAFPDFIRYLPVIWMANLMWLGVLTVLKNVGLIEAFSPQELIETFSQSGAPLATILLAIFAVLLAPVVEEIVFRGVVYRFLKSQTTPLLAQIASGFFFAIMHGNLMSLMPLMVVGIVLARIYERHGNILVPMCFHAYFNGFSLLLLFITHQSKIPFG